MKSPLASIAWIIPTTYHGIAERLADLLVAGRVAVIRRDELVDGRRRFGRIRHDS